MNIGVSKCASELCCRNRQMLRTKNPVVGEGNRSADGTRHAHAHSHLESAQLYHQLGLVRNPRYPGTPRSWIGNSFHGTIVVKKAIPLNMEIMPSTPNLLPGSLKFLSKYFTFTINLYRAQQASSSSHLKLLQLAI